MVNKKWNGSVMIVWWECEMTLKQTIPQEGLVKLEYQWSMVTEYGAFVQTKRARSRLDLSLRPNERHICLKKRNDKDCGSHFTRTDTCSYLLLFPVLLVELFTTLAGALLSPHMVRTGSTSAALRYFPDWEGDRSKNAKWKLTTVKSMVWNALFSLMLTVSDLTAISGSFPPSLISFRDVNVWTSFWLCR